MTGIEEALSERAKSWQLLGQPNALEAFVLEHGQEFHPVPRPEGVELGERKMCFNNSLEIVLNDNPDGEFIYVEGFMMSPNIPLLIHHAWVAYDQSDDAIEVTIPDNAGYQYWGIAYQTHYAVEVMNRVGCTGRTLEQHARGILIQP